MALAGAAGLIAPAPDPGRGPHFGLRQARHRGRLLFTLGSKNVPSAEPVLLSFTEVVLAPVRVRLAFGEVPSVPTLVGGLVLLGSIAGQAAAGMRR